MGPKEELKLFDAFLVNTDFVEYLCKAIGESRRRVWTQPDYLAVKFKLSKERGAKYSLPTPPRVSPSFEFTNQTADNRSR
jgi:hypothetical protein